MMFLSCFLLLNLIAEHGTSMAVPVNENLGKSQHIPEQRQSQYTQDGKECPKYRLVKKYSGFEHREYEESLWVTTPMALTEDGIQRSYNTLLQYYKGSNSQGVHMSVTAPVQIEMQFSDGVSVAAVMRMFLSVKLTTPPVPLKSTKLKKFNKLSAYVRSFIGDISGDTIQENLNALMDDIQRQGLQYDVPFLVCNIFDFNSQSTKILNEIWLPAQSD